MYAPQKRISLHTMTKADRYLVKIKVSEDNSIFKETFEQKMKKDGYLISAARQERTKDALLTSHLSHHDHLFVDVRVCVTDLAVVIMNQEGPH